MLLINSKLLILLNLVELQFIVFLINLLILLQSMKLLEIKKAFGEHAYDVVISSTKSMTGPMLGAAAAVEAIASTLAVKEGIVPPTINYKAVSYTHLKILGTGSYAPEHVVTNDDLSALVDTNDEWITQRIGVRSRHLSLIHI